MLFSGLFGLGDNVDLKDLKTLKFHVYESWTTWRNRKRVAVWGLMIAYLGVVLWTESLVAAVAGGAILLSLRLWSVESELYYRLAFLGDLQIELHNHSRDSLQMIGERLDRGLPNGR